MAVSWARHGYVCVKILWFSCCIPEKPQEGYPQKTQTMAATCGNLASLLGRLNIQVCALLGWGLCPNCSTSCIFQKSGGVTNLCKCMRGVQSFLVEVELLRYLIVGSAVVLCLVQNQSVYGMWWLLDVLASHYRVRIWNYVNPGLTNPWLINRGCPLLVGIHHFWREHPPNSGTGLFILGQH